MAQYEELTIDKGTDVTLQLELEDTNGNAKILQITRLQVNLRKLIIRLMAKQPYLLLR